MLLQVPFFRLFWQVHDERGGVHEHQILAVADTQLRLGWHEWHALFDHHGDALVPSIGVGWMGLTPMSISIASVDDMGPVAYAQMFFAVFIFNAFS